MTTKAKQTKVTCTVGNIWTSKGKLQKGDSVMLGPEEAKQIKAAMKPSKEGG